MKLSTKAQTLTQISNALSYAQVLPIHSFTVAQFRRRPKDIIERVMNVFRDRNIIVRSSALSEDTSQSSNAGHYTSIPDVDSNSYMDIANAITEVISEFDPNPRNEILIQPMLKEPKYVGVAFTADVDTLAPYYTINYDESGNTESITNGTAADPKTFVSFKQAIPRSTPKWILQLIDQLKELEVLFNKSHLDVEFATDHGNRLYILQVREICTTGKRDLSSVDLLPLLKKIRKKVSKLQKQHPNVSGNTTFFGVMPDWNPAEIIGIKPKKLALTLYKELITDKVWATQRSNYGYRSLQAHPLLVSYLGIPYIDLRVDFNSFIPNTLPESIANRLVNHYLSKFEKQPYLHDKIEFDIVQSCLHFTAAEQIFRDLKYTFSPQEIREITDSLRTITDSIIERTSGHFAQDLARIQILDSRLDAITNSDLAIIDKIYWLTQDCKEYGTLPFAGIARAAFIATQFLNSMKELRILSPERYARYYESLKTISKELKEHSSSLYKNKRSTEAFLKRFGHLRPGTYDITSPRYDNNFETYFPQDSQNDFPEENSEEPFEFTSLERDKLQRHLDSNGLTATCDDLIWFLKTAIETRESAKLTFTRNVSAILQHIEELGARFGLSVEDMAYLDLRELLKLYVELDHRNLSEILEQNIALNRDHHQYTLAVRLPNVIAQPEDVFGFFISEESPNFISLNEIEGDIIHEDKISRSDCNGKIVMIQSADPGYDYLFTKGIGGLITQYGGANSHMAIRCAEQGIPAVIGAGEKLFSKWSQQSRLRITASSEQVTSVV
ncbi:MAG: PEP-utilizing enzyme [Verrucomicrobiota bacterium]